MGNEVLQKLKIEFPIALNATADDARTIFQTLIPILHERISLSLSSDFAVQTDELIDPAKAISDMSKREEKDVVLSQTINVWRGWREGASVKLSWNHKSPGLVELRSYKSSKLEDSIGSILIIWPGVMLAAMQMFTGNIKLLKMLLWGSAGAVGGFLIYCIAAVPILSILSRKYAQSSEQIALKAHAAAEKAMRESFVERRL